MIYFAGLADYSGPFGVTLDTFGANGLPDAHTHDMVAGKFECSVCEDHYRRVIQAWVDAGSVGQRPLPDLEFIG